jgi:hypothetical protein
MPVVEGQEEDQHLQQAKMMWRGCTSDELGQMATFSCHLEKSLAFEAQGSTLTPLSTTIATHAKQGARRRQHSKHRKKS